MFKINIKSRIVICVFVIFFLNSSLIFADAEDVFYEVFVRSFYDSNGDGIGDFNGLTERLDYLNDGTPQTTADLGIKGIWLMPFLKASSYHGYDVVDYFKIEPAYGNEEDFQRFIAEAHKRGIRVIMDLVLNHTSSNHPWFLESCMAKDSKKEDLFTDLFSDLSSEASAKEDWYIWKDKMPEGWTKPWGGGESQDVWHYKNGAYYYSSFCSGMPDLNCKSEEVIEEMERIIKYWLDKSVDGFRLDAVRYLIEKNGGVSGQADLKETHNLLKRLASCAKSVNKDCILVGEVWTGNEIVSTYYGKGDELDGAFNFDLAGAIINSIKYNNYREIENLLNRMSKYDAPVNFYLPFLANHDQNRVASELDGDIQKLKLAAGLLLSMKGIPFIYYGEEIGMTGKDRHERIRTPMQWDDTENSGFSKGKPWERLQDNFKEINVKFQEKDECSLLNYYKELIRIRNKYGDILKGERKLVSTNNDKVYAYIYTDNKEGLLFIHNFKDMEVKNTRINISEAIFNSRRCKVVNLLNKDMQSITWLNSDEFKIIFLDRYGSLILKFTRK